MCNSKGLKHSIINDFGVVVQSNDVNKVKHFYCLANSACASTKNRYKMSHGCTSGPTDHLLSRHGKKIELKNRLWLITQEQNCKVDAVNVMWDTDDYSILDIPGPAFFIPDPAVFYTGSGLFYTGSGLFCRIRLYLTFVDFKRI